MCARADDHHWTAVQAGHTNPLSCGPSYIVGVGSESRNSKVIFPSGYGYYVAPKDNVFGANLHLLHTVGLSGADKYQAAKVSSCRTHTYTHTHARAHTHTHTHSARSVRGRREHHISIRARPACDGLWERAQIARCRCHQCTLLALPRPDCCPHRTAPHDA
jgi:hypothetical protein